MEPPVTNSSSQGHFNPAIDSDKVKPVPSQWVRESYLGRKFLSSHTWLKWVLRIAFNDFKRLLGDDFYESKVILDAGCGHGFAFGLIDQHFKPEKIIGIDIDAEQIARANETEFSLGAEVEFINASMATPLLEPNSVDLILCHQLLHHTADQEKVLSQFMLALKPGGVLLVGESCKKFINLWWVKWFFRHPHSAQKTADEYIRLVEAKGFEKIKTQKTTPWWSRWDNGMLEKVGLQKEAELETTEVLIVARKPLA